MKKYQVFVNSVITQKGVKIFEIEAISKKDAINKVKLADNEYYYEFEVETHKNTLDENHYAKKVK